MKFTYNPRILRHLGTELITTDEIALTELIKNSYDAKAKKAKIHFIDQLNQLQGKTVESIPNPILERVSKNEQYGIIVLEDNGHGMDETTLEEGFFEVGSNHKVDLKEAQKEKKENKEVILGDKGIGRLSAQRLSPILVLETLSNNEDDILWVEINWNEFIANPNMDAPVKKIPKSSSKSYTRMWFLGSKEEPMDFDRYYQNEHIFQLDIYGQPGKPLGVQPVLAKELKSAFSMLHSPFEEKKMLIDIDVNGLGKPISLEFGNDTLNLAESVHSFDSTVVYDENGENPDLKITMKSTITPWFLERVHYNLIGKTLYQSHKRTPNEYKALITKYKENFSQTLSDSILLSQLINDKKWPKGFLKSILDIAPVKGAVYSFKRQHYLMKMAIDSALATKVIKEDVDLKDGIEAYLKANNGIKLYRNNFRIGTIGNKEDDWMKLQQKRTSGQQFYRFEIGNVVGYVRVNDVYQEYINETSSREHLKDNEHSEALKAMLDYIFEIFSPKFTKQAFEISRDIFEQEGLIPRNDTQELKEEVDKSKELIKVAKANIKALKNTFKVIQENIELDTEGKKEALQNVLNGLLDTSLDFEENLDGVSMAFENANRVNNIALNEVKRIEGESYNNYKLMANGLITEVITHELYSVLSNADEEEEHLDHFEALKDYLFEMKNYELNANHLQPVSNRFKSLHNTMRELNRFYVFLEKTFIYRGNASDFETVKLYDYISDVEERFKSRLVKNKIDLDYESVSNSWSVPKGSLIHVFYNLIENSIYWINERKLRARHDKTFISQKPDSIAIRTMDKNTIRFFDTGTGVLANMENSLFYHLESGKKNGRGMGLYIVRNFLRSFGADINLLTDTNEFGNRYIFEIRIKQDTPTENE